MIEVARPTWLELSLLWKFYPFRIIYFMSENESSIVPELYILGVVEFVMKERRGVIRESREVVRDISTSTPSQFGLGLKLPNLGISTELFHSEDNKACLFDDERKLLRSNFAEEFCIASSSSTSIRTISLPRSQISNH